MDEGPTDLTAEEAAEQHRQAVREEKRRLRYLGFLVDLALKERRAGRYTRLQAEKIVGNICSQARKLFPGKELAFDLICRPRFR